MKVDIRTAHPDEVGSILELWGRAESPPTVTDDARSLHALLARDPEALLVAVVKGDVIGTLIATWDGWRGNMYRLAVHPSHRRRGIASRLVAEGERRLRDQGCRRITALVLRDEPHAVGLWREVGFVEQPEMVRFHRNID
jgi:ribosomal protein S18 acetylase RimI-like enzyme